MAWSMIDSLLGLYLVWTLMGFALATVLYEPAFAVLAVWFERRRPAALTVLTFVAGFASVIFLPLAGWWVETLGWREALRALAWVLWHHGPAARARAAAAPTRRRPDRRRRTVAGARSRMAMGSRAAMRSPTRRPLRHPGPAWLASLAATPRSPRPLRSLGR
jgi:MFS family permease